MEIKNKIKLAEEILKISPYSVQKKKISELFDKTKNSDYEDIILRLIVIDSCYSTNMNRRLFAFEELTNLILKIEPQLNENINVEKFVEKNFELLVSPIGIDKKGNSTKHAFSLITKYIYFRTKFNFPIYDRLVFDGLVDEKLIELPQKPSITYFKRLISLKDKYGISFDELDKYFWVCGKVRKGSLSLLIDNKEDYRKMLKELNISDSNNEGTSVEFDDLVKHKLKESNIDNFKDKLKNIKTLFDELEK